MENIAKNSPNSLSPTDEPKSDASMDVSPTQNVDVDVARIEGGRSSGGEERLKMHSSHENIRIPWLVEELASGQGINHKRKKLSEGDDEVTSEEISKKLSLNDPATQVKKVKVSNAQENEVDLSTRDNKDVGRAIRFDLNYPPIDEGDDEVISEVETLKLFPSLDDPTTQKNGIDPSNGEHNDVDRAIRFDLNNPPIDEDSQVSTDLSLATTEEWNGVVESVNINVRCFNGSKFPVQVTLKSTVGSFKNIIARDRDIPAGQQRLIYKGRILKDDQTLQSYGLEADHAVYLARSFAPTNTNGETNSSGTDTTTSNGGGAGANDGGGLGGLGLGASLFLGLGINGTGGNGLFGEGFPDHEQMQQLFISNPDIVIEIMNTPAMQNLMNNPEIVQNLIVNNPEVQELMDRNPELAHIVIDPSTLCETLEAPRNPEIMREMMRNMDVEMNNIESSPEGFNMLRRMYEDDEAFLNATTTAGDTGISGTLGGQAMDQSINPSITASETIAGSPFPNTNPLPNPWSSTGTGSAQAPIDLGGLGLPELEGMLGGSAMPDAALLTQLMQNPAISQMMQSMLSNPQTLSQILGANTEQQGMPDLNSVGEVMQNMEFLHLFSSPETLQQPLSFQQALPSQPSLPQSTWELRQTSGGTGSLINLGLELLSSMFGELGAGNVAFPNRSNEPPPEQLYANQLSQLQEMGFFDTQENIRALIATSGNVQEAVEWLLGNSGQ